MTKIRPFRAVRPHRDKAHLVGSRSYLNYSEFELNDKLKGNPFTFLHIIKPEMAESIRESMTRLQRYELVRDGYQYFKKIGFLMKEEKESMYVYRQTTSENTFTGLIAGVAVEDYTSGKIKKHEETLTRRERLFHDYLEVTGFNAEPVLLTYEDDVSVDDIVDQVKAQRPEFEFYTTDMVKHELWVIDDKATQETLQENFERIPEMYLGDGHHRSASSALLAASHGNDPDQPHAFFMALFLPSSNLRISGFHRLVRNLNELGRNEFLTQITDRFNIHDEEDGYAPRKPGEIGLYLKGSWFSLTLKTPVDSEHAADHLDARIVSRNILKPILGVEDIRNDDRIEFMPGSFGMEGLMDAVDRGLFAAAIALYPVSFEDLKAVSDQGEIMPPKSTYVEPKLRSGLTIYELFDR